MRNSKRFYQVMSLLMAILLWIYVVAEENLFLERTFTADVSYINLEGSLIPAGKMPTVNVSIRGDQNTINKLNSSDFSVFVDLKEAEKGENVAQVQVEGPDDVKLVSVSPSKIYLKLDERAEKQVPLDVKITGHTREGFSSFEASLKTSHVTISGPKEMLTAIFSAEVEANLDYADSNLSLQLIPKINGLLGQFDADVITVKPEMVDVFIPVIEDNPSKSVPVVANLTGIPAYGYKVSRVVVEPDILRISGANELIAEIKEVSTTNIDITNMKDEVVAELGLLIPDKVTSLYENRIKVIVLFEKVMTEKRVEKKIEIRNMPEGENLKASQQNISLILKGYELDFQNFLMEDLHVYVDAEKFQGTSMDFPVKVAGPENIEIMEINPGKISLTKESN